MTKVRSRNAEPPKMIFLSTLLNLGTAYNEDQKTPEVTALFFDQYSEAQAHKAYTAFSKKIRELIITRTVKGLLTDRKFVIGEKKKRDNTVTPLLLQDIALLLNKALASRIQGILDEIREEVPFTAPVRGIKSGAVSLEDLENMSEDDFEAFFISTAETLQARKERGEAVGKAKSGKKNGKKSKAEPETSKAEPDDDDDDDDFDPDSDFSDLSDDSDNDDDDDDDTPPEPVKKPNPNKPSGTAQKKTAPPAEPTPAQKKKPREANETVKSSAAPAVKRKRPSGF